MIILDVSNPAKPVRLGNYHSPAVLRQMVKSGDLLYVADAWNGFTVLDVSDSAHPEVVSVYLAEQIDASNQCGLVLAQLGVGASGIAFNDNKIYLSAGHLGLEVIDVADPANPTLLGAIRIKEIEETAIPSSRFSGLSVQGDVASVGYEEFVCGFGSTIFLNIDISDPAKMIEIGQAFHSYPAAVTIERAESGAAFIGRNLGYATGGSELTIDTSDPSNPEILHIGGLLSINDVALYGSVLYLASDFSGDGAHDPEWGLYIQDITDPANPVQLAIINETTPLADGVELKIPIAVAVQGQRLFVVGNGCIPQGICGYSLYIFDISNPSAPVFLSLQPIVGSIDTGLLVDETAVYVTNVFSNLPRAGLSIVETEEANTADLDGDGVVGISDLLILFANWGPCPPPERGNCPADLDGDSTVNTADLLILFANWG